MTTSKLFKVLGSSDDQTTCDLCGRTELKKTAILEVLDADGNGTGQIQRYGVDCAARATGWTQKDVTRLVKDADEAARKLEARKRSEESDRRTAVWFTWLTDQTGIQSAPEAMAALGGFGPAHKAFMADGGYDR